jgi:glyoxylase-like metal-dependent hydrolase (beta-lactamase superfamily II)
MGYSVFVFRVRSQLIDTGFPGARDDVARLITEARPRGVIVTHQHEDHAGNVDLFAQRGVPVAIAPTTEQALRAGEPHIGLYRRLCWGTPTALRDRLERYEPEGLQMIHTPGHSPDHHIVWDAERATLFSADLFLGMRVRVARPMEDPRALARSVRLAVALEPRAVYDSHRGLVPNGRDALRRKADWLNATIDAVDARLRQGWSDRAIARDVLGRESVLAVISGGDLSQLNFVRALRATAATAAGAGQETARARR